MIKIAINGFGRIGRAAFKIALTKKNIKVVAINDLTSTDNLAYLLKYDSVYGIYDKKVKAGKNFIQINNQKFPVYSEKEPKKLPWKNLKVDVVLECTGVFTKEEEAGQHLKAGAKQVIISAPTKSTGVETVVLGANEGVAKNKKIISNASCTTNCVSPIMAILESNFGIEKAIMNTIHAYTATQRTVDGPNSKDFLRGRAAAQNMILTTTGAAKATAKTLTGLEDKFDGLAVRVPVVCGSLTDLTVVLKKEVTVEKVNQAFKKFAKHPLYKNVLAVTEEPLASADIIGSPYSAIINLNFTKVVGGDLVKIMAWYDNEWGYANRLVDIISYL